MLIKYTFYPLILLGLIGIVGCGRVGILEPPTDSSITKPPDIQFDITMDTVVTPPDPTNCKTTLPIFMRTQAACAIKPLPGNSFHSQATLTEKGKVYTLLAIDPYGKGWMGYYCDFTTLADIMNKYPALIAHLSGKSIARVMLVGRCLWQSTKPKLPNQHVYQFNEKGLPKKYIGRSDLLAQDIDLVVFCPERIEHSSTVTAAEKNTYNDFVAKHGKGLLLISDYYSKNPHSGVPDPQKVKQFDILNHIANKAGAEFLRISLEWGPMQGTFRLFCD